MSNNNNNKARYNFRKAQKSDIKIVLQMIQELADFENMPNGPQLSEADLIRDSGLNGEPEICHIYILELLQNNNDDGEKFKHVTIAYAICYISYSTWQGKCYFLEDIYVRREYRGRGAGTRILYEIAGIAKILQCKRIEFNVLAWNPAIKFYKKFNAIDFTEQQSWHLYRLNGKQIETLAQQLKNILKKMPFSKNTIKRHNN